MLSQLINLEILNHLILASISMIHGAWIKLQILVISVVVIGLIILMILHVGKYRPFTVDDFPRVSCDHDEQCNALFYNSEIRCRGPKPLMLFPAFKGGRHAFGEYYHLYDESEINLNNVRTIDCSNRCRCHPCSLLQFIDLKITGYRHDQPGCAKIFGFFATRDQMEPLRNYVYRREIDNYEAVTVMRNAGMARLSLTSPARGIYMTSHVLFEFKLCVRTEDPPKDGPKGDILIEGCAEFVEMLKSESFIENRRLYGEECGLDVKYAVLVNAVQAKVNVKILRAPACGLDLNLCARTSGFRDVIRLFRGVAETGSEMSSIVAVMARSFLDLRIEVSPKDDGIRQKLFEVSPKDDGIHQKPSSYVWKGRFESCFHGTTAEVVNLDKFTTISVDVTWKAVRS